MPAIKLDAVTIDCPDAKALATFYHQLTGMRIVEVEDGYEPVVAGKPIDLMFQEIDTYQPPTWPTQERGQQIHLDCTCRDIEAGAAFAESIGARRALEQPGERWRVMLDPAGHPFCLSHYP
ncbi:MAG TPA: VOC family protein [Thermomicrobiales bacterium]|nr:VOC family protein [Thermomicrobiales bacterium]